MCLGQGHQLLGAHPALSPFHAGQLPAAEPATPEAPDSANSLHFFFQCLEGYPPQQPPAPQLPGRRRSLYHVRSLRIQFASVKTKIPPPSFLNQGTGPPICTHFKDIVSP
jgi:hypothetical protein